MSRIEIRIRSLVVHGGRSFDGDAFSTALGGEIASHIGAAPRVSDIASRFKVEARDGAATPREAPLSNRFEPMIAARVAKRLLP